MFLNELPQELIKPYLSLAQALMSADGKFTDEEKNLFSLYAVEINLSELPEVEIMEVEDILPLFSKLAPADKKKVYFELVSLAYADSDFSDEEKALLETIGKDWNLSSDVKERLERIVERLMIDYELLGEIINE